MGWAEFASDGAYRHLFDTAQQHISYYKVSMADDRPVYRVFGYITGIGSDGEPLLKVSKFVTI
jgi:hypothetical protein